MYGGYPSSYPSLPHYPVPPVMTAAGNRPPVPLTSNDDADILGLIQHLDKDELQKLLDSDEKMDSMISDSKQIRNILAEKETVLSCNRSLAEFNLSMQPKFECGKGELVALHDEAKMERSNYDLNKSKLDSFSQSTSLDTVLALLQAAAAESEEKTENMANDFVNGRLDITQFISEYITERQHAHTRRIKAEKMADLVNRAALVQNQAGNRSAAQPLQGLPSPAQWNGVYGAQPMYAGAQAPMTYRPPFSYGSH